MSLTLRQTGTPAQRLDFSRIAPQALDGLTDSELAALPLQVGNRQHRIDDYFTISRQSGDDDLLVIETTDARIDFLGSGMQQGRLIVRGDAGDYAARGLNGGSVVIEGNCGDLAGSGLRAGTLRVDGNAGDRVGAPGSGELRGQQGGLIHVLGDIGSRGGERMRRGTLLVGGNAGDLLGYRMIAGTIHIGGQAGVQTGYGMRRGSILLRNSPLGMSETMRANGRQRPAFLPLLMRELRRLSGDRLESDGITAADRFLGDLACDGKGEILLLD